MGKVLNLKEIQTTANLVSGRYTDQKSDKCIYYT